MRRRRSQRTWPDIAQDPHTPYMIGQLLGANQMAIALLSQEDSPAAKNVSQVLKQIQDYFIEEGSMSISTGEPLAH